MVCHLEMLHLRGNVQVNPTAGPLSEPRLGGSVPIGTTLCSVGVVTCSRDPLGGIATHPRGREHSGITGS